MALAPHAQEVRREMEHKIFVSVQGGVAEVCEETVPPGIVVEILDFDNWRAPLRRRSAVPSETIAGQACELSRKKHRSLVVRLFLARIATNCWDDGFQP